MDNLSPDLRYALTGFLSQLFMGQLYDAEAVATALDKLSDLAWEEADSDEQDELESTPPSMRFDGAG